MIALDDEPQGSPPFSVDEDELRLILDIVTRGSQVVARGPRMAVMNERRICRRLKRAMVRVKRANYASANIRIEREVTVDPELDELALGSEDDDEEDGDLADELPEGRIDLCFYLPSHVGQEQAYFGIEAKLVRQGQSKLNNCYVNNGIDRFHRGLYGPRMSHGMMLGFVMRGEGRKIAASINRYMRRKWGDGYTLGDAMPSGAGLSTFRGPLPRRPAHVDMELLHVFADMSVHEPPPDQPKTSATPRASGTGTRAGVASRAHPDEASPAARPASSGPRRGAGGLTRAGRPETRRRDR